MPHIKPQGSSTSSVKHHSNKNIIKQNCDETKQWGQRGSEARRQENHKEDHN